MNSHTVSLSVLVFASLVSGLAGAVLTVFIQVARENRRFKVDTLKKFAANRFDLRGDEFTRALNEIVVVFSRQNDVIDRLEEFHTAITSRAGNADDELLRLYKALCKACHIRQRMNDSFFLRPFNTRQSSVQPAPRAQPHP